jgi:AP2 domain
VKTIQLTQGFVALIDDADFERVSAHKWSATKTKTNVYGIRKIRRGDRNTTSQLLHRFIMGVTNPKLDVDHEDHDGLNCQRYNLRVATRTQNNANRLKSVGASQYKGVSWDTSRRKWRGCITLNGRTKHVGRFADEISAALAYDAAARAHFGEFALCNFPPKMPCAGRALASMMDVVRNPA